VILLCRFGNAVQVRAPGRQRAKPETIAHSLIDLCAGRAVRRAAGPSQHEVLLLSDFTAAVHFDLHLLAILLRGASVMQGDVGIALLLKTLPHLRLAHHLN
jgi:hypothetical protein